MGWLHVYAVTRARLNSRQNTVMLNLILQRREGLGDGFALLGLLSILLGRDGLVHIINSASLEWLKSSSSACSPSLSIHKIIQSEELTTITYKDDGPPVPSRIVTERVLVRIVRRGCIARRKCNSQPLYQFIILKNGPSGQDTRHVSDQRHQKRFQTEACKKNRARGTHGSWYRTP